MGNKRMRCKSRVLVKNSLSKKILSFYIIILLIVTFSSNFGISNPPQIEIVGPTDGNYYTNNTYVNISVNITSDSYNSSFINWNYSLVGYWNFEHTNDTHVFDNSTYMNNATCIGRNGTRNITVGKYGNGSYFNGSSNEYLDCGNHSSLDISSNNITIEFWVKEFESSFNNKYGNSTSNNKNDDYGSSIRQTSDGCYIVTGEVDHDDSDPDNTGNISLIKLDSNGGVLWQKFYGSGKNNKSWDVQQTFDGGYIIVGERNTTYNWYDVFLIKTDSSGNLEWEEIYGGGENDTGYSVQQTSDGGYIITGYTESFGTGNKDAWLLKTNSTGEITAGITNNETFNRTFGGLENDSGWSVKQTNDSGYIIVGDTQSYGNGSTDYWDLWLIKTNSTGNESGLDTHTGNWTWGGPSSYENGRDVQLLSNNSGYIITGFTDWDTNDLFNVWLIKLNWTCSNSSSGEVFNKNYSFVGVAPNKGDKGFSVDETTDSGFIIAGSWNEPNTTDGGLLLMKTDAQGNELWNRSFGEQNKYERALCVEETTDGGFILVGQEENSTSDSDNRDIWVIKTDVYGNVTESNNNQSLYKTLVGKSTDTYLVKLYNGTIYGYINDESRVSTNMSLYDLSQYWHHVALTYNGSEIKLYVNGTLMDSTAYNGVININTNNLTIGKNFSGIIDEVRIWSRTLNQDEINASYSCSGSYYKNFTGLSEGNYSYYVYAIDINGNENSTQTRTVTIDNIPPASSVNEITPYNQSNENIIISITGSDATGCLQSVALYYYNSTNNYTWSGPFSYYTNTTPWFNINAINISFNFSNANGSGYYRFYSIATDNASNTEEAPSSYDTACYFSVNNSPPNASTISSPSNGAIEVSRTTDLNWVYAGDPDGDDSANATYDVYFGTDSSPGSGELVSSNQSTTTYDTGTMSYSTTYYWMIITYDNYSIGTPGPIWSFTTVEQTGGNGYTPPTNTPPTADAGGPYSGYVNIPISLDGSGSSDSDGTIAGYRWDFENDDTYDTDWLTTAMTTHSYYSVGNYTVKLQVKDDDGATGTDTATVTITEAPPVDNPPTISNITRSPRKVTSDDIVTISADVTDDYGVSSVFLYWNNGSNDKSAEMVNIGGDKYSKSIGPFPYRTTVTYWIKAIDNADNISTIDELNFTVAAPPLTKELDIVTNGTEEEVVTEGAATSRIKFQSKKDLQNVNITIENLTKEELEDKVYLGDKEVYKYFNLTITANGTHVQEDDIESSTIEFEVNKTWINELRIDDNGNKYRINKSDIKLLRYKNNRWGNLTTTLISEEHEAYILYEAETLGYSTFAVVGSKVVEKGPPEPDEPEIPWIIIIGVIIAAIIILLFVLFKARYIYIEEVEVPEK